MQLDVCPPSFGPPGTACHGWHAAGFSTVRRAVFNADGRRTALSDLHDLAPVLAGNSSTLLLPMLHPYLYHHLQPLSIYPTPSRPTTPHFPGPDSSTLPLPTNLMPTLPYLSPLVDGNFTPWYSRLLRLTTLILLCARGSRTGGGVHSPSC
eukprot:215851-Hanusia_phi.AAC.1